MTSLIESASSVDFKAAMDTAERLSSLLCGYGEDGSINPQQSSLIALDDDLWKELYLLPTPPLSPECLNSTSSSNTHVDPPSNVQGAVGGAGLYTNMMEYDQMMDVLEEAERVLGDSQQSFQQDLLLQDCMWSGGNYADGLLSTTANPTLAAVPTKSSSAGCTNTTIAEGSSCHEPNDEALDESQCSNPEPEPDCVEPSAVFPVLRNSTDAAKKTSTHKSSSSASSMRSHASMSSSESGQLMSVAFILWAISYPYKFNYINFLYLVLIHFLFCFFRRRNRRSDS